MKITRILDIGSWALVMVFSLFGFAQEMDRRPNDQDRGRPQREWLDDEQKRRIKEVLEKQQQGQPLNREEMELLERVRAWKERQGGRGPEQGFGKFPREENLFADLGELNAVDKAVFDIAAILCEKGEYENAVKELAKAGANSPDDRAKSGAHLVAGHIYRQKIGNTEKAIEEYKQVTGDLARRATKAIIRCYEEIGQPGKAADLLEARLPQAATPADKADVLNEIAAIYRRNGDTDKAIEALRRIPQLITYEEAETIRKQMIERPTLDYMEKILEKIGELRQMGRHEEAERLEQQARDMKQRMAAPMERGEGGEKPFKKPEDR